MDVSCEKCLTVYEFDDAQVSLAGVTVKCTQCGHLFKVKRRDSQPNPMAPAQARSQAYVGPAVAPRPAAPPPAAPPPQQQETSRPRRNTSPFGFVPDQPPAAAAPTPSRATVPERRPEPTPRPAPAPSRGLPLALSATAPMARPPVLRPPPSAPEGPTSMGVREPTPSRPIRVSGPTEQGPAPRRPTAPTPSPDDGADVERTGERTNPTAKVSALSTELPQLVDDLADLDEPATRSRWPIVIVLLLAVVGGGAAGAYMFRKELGLTGRGSVKAQKMLADGRAQFLIDTDDGFRRAASLFQQARGADESSARALGALAELEVTWAHYLREDARDLDAVGPAAAPVAKQLRKDAQTHLDEGKHEAEDAVALDPEAPEANRAMADFLRVDGGPLAEAARYLKRALDKAPSDPEALYVEGALALREGKPADARIALERANQLFQQAGGKPLVRALYLLARLAQDGGQKEIARQHLKALLAESPQHERAKALLAALDAPSAGAAAPPGTIPPTAGAPPAGAIPPVGASPPAVVPPSVGGPAAAVPPTAGAKPGSEEKLLPNDYRKLVAQADRLSENGRADAARKLYERALQLQPNGVEALTGIGYCDLDKERFMGAVDHFKHALTISPSYGEAIIGLAESYKVRGDRAQAVEYYRRYLKADPGGAKAAMAQKNIKELEAARPAPAPEGARTGEGHEARPGASGLPRPPPAVDDPPPP